MRKYESRSKVKLNAEKLLAWRADKELTQKKAAKKAKVSIVTYQMAEYGNEVQLVSASRIAKAAQVPLEELKEERSA